MKQLPVRRQILQLVQSALREAGTDAGDTVLVERLNDLPAKRCPAILLRYAKVPETIGQLDLEGNQERTLSLLVACAIEGGEEFGEALDVFATQVETALAADVDQATPGMQRIHGMCAGGVGLAPASGVDWFLSGEGENVVGVCMQTWNFTYYVHPARSYVAIT